jgi:hypothetical protein
MHTNLTFAPMTDIVVLGTNPENADFDNPRGHIYGFAAYVVAEDELGNRRRLHVSSGRIESELLQDAGVMAERLTARLKNFNKLPVCFESWEETFPAYGSAAYSEEDTIAWERRLEEDACFS